MRNTVNEKVLSVHHWNDTLFSFKTTRQQGLTFESGQFVMIGLEVNGRPLLRAYSIASPHYADELEFFSIKVPDGALTSQLQKIKIDDEIIVTTRPTGTLVPGYLNAGKYLYLLSTGTGLAPFMSIIRDPFIYDDFEKVILVHCVRFASELAYQDEIINILPENEYYGDLIKEKLIYYPSVTRENNLDAVDDKATQIQMHHERITTLITSGKLSSDIGLPKLNTDSDRFMLCGNNDMLQDTMTLLDNLGFSKATSRVKGDYVIEQAFIDK
jgi:ferredoxin--NADP+ reductase